MKKHSLKVMISLLLVVSFTLGIVPVTVVAEKPKNTLTDLQKLAAGMVSVEDVYGALDSRTVPEIIGYDYAVSKAHVQRLYEDEGDNLNKVVFLNADGSRTAYLFDYPVKYVDDDGKPKDITLDIADSAVAGQFETAGGSAVTTFSGNVSDGIGLTGNHTSLSLVPHLPTVKADAVAVKSSGKTMDSTAKRVDSKTISYDYDSKTTIEYSLTYTGFKEDIVVSEYTGQTEYDFTLYTNGLTLKETDGNFYLVDRDNTVKATLGDIIIFTADEKNNTMGELRSQTVVENQEYLLTIVVDAEYLAAEETAYPIRIDPTVELCYDNNGSGAIEDATINSTGTTAGSSGSLMVGLRESYGISRILMKFPGLDLDDLGDNVSITNATVELRDLMCESTGLEVSCYVFSGNTWSESSVNWSNVSPNSVSTFLSSHTISYSNGTKQATAHRYAFDITKAVEGWIAGNYNPNKGIVFKASNSVENGTTYKHKTMAAYNRSSHKPSLSVTYLTNTNLMSNDTYYLNNLFCGDYLRYTSSAVTATSGLISSLGNSIRWELRAVDGGYVIRAKSDTTKYLGVPTSTGSSSVEVVSVSDAAVPARCIWSIRVSAVGGCLVKNTYNARYLYSQGDAASTVSGTGTAETEAYNKRVWRIISTSYYGNSSSYDARELQSGFTIDPLIINVGATKTPSIVAYPEGAIWCDANDFTYLHYSGTIGCATFNSQTGNMTGYDIGIAQYKAIHKVTNQTYVFTIYVDRYTYELVQFFGFENDEALLVRDVYNRIDDYYDSSTEIYKAWVASRVLSEFSYDGPYTILGFPVINKWDNVAGSVTDQENREQYFLNVLGYTQSDYATINSALVNQHYETETSDFTHMQYAIAARLAYVLSLDGDLSNVYTLDNDETVSYLGGWLGDATLLNDGTTVFKNDDYLADLDAENIFREIDGGKDSVAAINLYYEELESANSNRATIFQSYINYSAVVQKVCDQLHKTPEQIQTTYPDTYDFLMSLQNNRAVMGNY